jgi:hypothetical protein
MLDTLITSKTRIKLLLKFFLNIQNRGYLKKLEVEFADSSNGIRLELNKLEEAGLLRSSLEGNKKYFEANTSNPIYQEIHSLLRKYTGIDQLVEKVLNQIGELQTAYLTGTLACGLQSDQIEMLLIGDLNQAYLDELIVKAEKLMAKKITYQVFSAFEFQIKKEQLLAQPHILLFG